MRQGDFAMKDAVMLSRSFAASIGAVLVLVSAEAADPGAPAAPPDPVTDTYFSVKVEDPYRWLESAADPKVKAWTAAETARTRAGLDGIAARKPIRDRLAQLTKGASGAWFDFQVTSKGIFAFHADPAHQQPLLLALGLDADPAKARIVLDPDKLDAKGGVALDWYVASPDGRFIAASLSRGGSEVGDLHIFSTDSGQEIGDVVPNVQNPTGGGSVAWRPDGKSYFYTRYPGPEKPAADRGFYQQLYLHQVGVDAKYDKLIIGPDLPRIAEIKLDNRFDPASVLVSVLKGDGGEVEHFLIGPKGDAVQLTHFEDQIRQAVQGPDGSIYLISRKGSPAGRILHLKPGETQLAQAKEIVKEGAAAITLDANALVPAGDRLYARQVVGGPSAIAIYSLDGKQTGTVPLPPVSAVEDMVLRPDGTLLLELGSFIRPLYVASYDPKTNALAETGIKVTSPAVFDDAEVVRLTAPSKDGTKIPFTVIRTKGFKAGGTAPTLLTGYGGYGVSQEPRFLNASGRVWLDGGGVWVSANIRGGGDFGEAWHKSGSLTHKQNVFDDFAAVAQELVRLKITSPQHLSLQGGSNGGLLMGAMITQHPDLAKAVVSWVGIYDMLRVELDPNGQFNTTEFGTVKDEAQFKALYAYSPYHHVRDGTKYPAVLMLTGENDGRVNPLQSRKFTARLQAATISGLPIYLETRSDAGHGIGTPLDVRIDQQADAMSFLFDQLGMGFKG
jgi:prolyl oligopeptidase